MAVIILNGSNCWHETNYFLLRVDEGTGVGNWAVTGNHSGQSLGVIMTSQSGGLFNWPGMLCSQVELVDCHRAYHRPV